MLRSVSESALGLEGRLARMSTESLALAMLALHVQGYSTPHGRQRRSSSSESEESESVGESGDDDEALAS